MRKSQPAIRAIMPVYALVLFISLGVPTTSNAQVQTFSDVPTDYWAFSFIRTFSATGITAGCGGDNYCPDTPLS